VEEVEVEISKGEKVVDSTMKRNKLNEKGLIFNKVFNKISLTFISKVL
jgi:hypothetical protein